MVFKKPPSPLTVRSEEQALRWFTITHALGMLSFVALMAGFFWYLHASEQQQQKQQLYRDVEWAQQNIRLRLSDAKELAAQLTPEWASYSSSEVMSGVPQSSNGIRSFFSKFPEVSFLAMVDGSRRILWHLPARPDATDGFRQAGTILEDSAGFSAYSEARELKRVAFSYPIITASRDIMIEMHAPDLTPSVSKDPPSLIVGISLSRLMVQAIAPEIRSRSQISVLDQGGNALVSTSPRTVFVSNFNYELPLDPPGHGILLKGALFETGSLLLSNRLVFALIGLSLAVALGMMLVWQHTRRRLRAENERDRLFILSLDLLCVTTEHGNLLKINPAFAGAFEGVSTTTRLSDLIHVHDRERVIDLLKGAKDSVYFEARNIVENLPNAEPVWLSWSMRRDTKSIPPQWYGVAHDITKRKSAETALAAEIAFRRAMEDSMVTGMRAFDLQGRVTYVNRAFCNMVGLDEIDLVGKTAPFPYWPSDAHEDHSTNLTLILSGQAPESGLEVQVQRKDGSRFDARMYVSPLIDASSIQTGWMTSMTDITEPKKIRRALTDAQERFTTVLDELEPAVSVLDDNGRLLFSNQTYQRILGQSNAGQERLCQKELSDPTSPNSAVEVFDQATAKWFDVQQRRIRWVDESLVTMMLATDVTRRHQAEEAQRAQEEKLQQSSRLVTMGEMASSLAHELNQPLSAIANYCMGLAARIRSSTQQGLPINSAETLEALKKASGQAERAGLVIKRIREFVKRAEPEQRQCNAAEIINNALTLVEIEAKKTNVKVIVNCPTVIPTLWADPILIEQVLINLLKNGIDSMRTTHSKNKRLELTFNCHEQLAKFEVRDYGCGFAPEAESKLFQPFYTTKAEGMGMGLNICRSIVEAHNGRLFVERHTDGSCFVFTLPLIHENTIL
jgi:PAS domain S-box-containing protein